MCVNAHHFTESIDDLNTSGLNHRDAKAEAGGQQQACYAGWSDRSASRLSCRWGANKHVDIANWIWHA
jgi:hypothetical protein